MALQGPHQVAKKSTTIKVPVSARAESKSALLWNLSVTALALYEFRYFSPQLLVESSGANVHTAAVWKHAQPRGRDQSWAGERSRYSRLEVVDTGRSH
jgi:hypothetical protein